MMNGNKPLTFRIIYDRIRSENKKRLTQTRNIMEWKEIEESIRQELIDRAFEEWVSEQCSEEESEEKIE